ncbi:MAG: DUF3153 domain-containing protein [bacterium]
MKKILLGLGLASLMLILAGCVKVSSHVTLNMKGGGEVEYVFAMDESLKDMASGFGSGTGVKAEDPFTKMKGAFEKDGFTVSDYKDGKNSGIKAIKKAKNTAEILAAIQTKALASNTQLSKGSGGLFETVGKSLKIEKKLFTTTYKLDASVDMGAEKSKPAKPGTPSDSASEMGKKFGESMASSMFDFTFALTLPVKPKSSNATTTSPDGRTLEWQLKPGEVNKMQTELTVPNVTNITIAFILLMVLIVIIAAKSRKPKKETVITANIAIPEPVIEPTIKPEIQKENIPVDSTASTESLTKAKMENDASETE